VSEKAPRHEAVSPAVIYYNIIWYPERYSSQCRRVMICLYIWMWRARTSSE